MMARIRTIKPEFWSSEQIMACTRGSRLLFIGIWNFADDAGRLKDSAKSIRAQVFPGDDDLNSEIVRGMVDELSANGLLQKYEVDGVGYLAITGWNHQKIDKPRPSKHPGPNSANVRRQVATDLTYLTDQGVDPTAKGGSLAPAPSPGAREPRKSSSASPGLQRIVAAKGWASG